MKASVRFDHELLAVEGEHTVHAMFELSVPEPQSDKPRPPLHLAVVIDRSGSMAGPKLDRTKEAAAYLVRRLASTDEVAIVTYDDQVDLIASLAPADPEALAHVIGGIWPGGMTNLSGGWLKGIEQLRRAAEDGSRKVLLLTDGLANQGISDRDTLVDMARQALAAGVGTTTIGFGDGFDEELLTRMAKAAGGNSHFIASPEDAPAIFADEFEDLTSLVAQNVSVEIRPSQEVKLLGVLNEFPSTEVVGGVQFALGDAYGGEQRRLVFELHIPELARLGVVTVAELVLRYVLVGDEIAAHELVLPLKINMVQADEASQAEPDKEVTEEVLILKAAKAQKEARERADGGDFDGAQMLLSRAASDIEAALPGSGRAQELQNEAAILHDQAGMAAPQNWGAASSKAVHFDANRKRQSHRRRPRD